MVSPLSTSSVGSIRQDIPTSGLAEMLNCQFFIASQCNPHIVPFFFNPKGGVGRPSRWSSGEQEHSWRGGFLLAALEMYLKVRMYSARIENHFLSWPVFTRVKFFVLHQICSHNDHSVCVSLE